MQMKWAVDRLWFCFIALNTDGIYLSSDYIRFKSEEAENFQVIANRRLGQIELLCKTQQKKWTAKKGQFLECSRDVVCECFHSWKHVSSQIIDLTSGGDMKVLFNFSFFTLNGLKSLYVLNANMSVSLHTRDFQSFSSKFSWKWCLVTLRFTLCLLVTLWPMNETKQLHLIWF